MFVLVDLENEFYSRWEDSRSRQFKFKQLIEDLSAQKCLQVRYDRLDIESLDKLGISGVIVSGNFTDFEKYNKANFAELYALFEHAYFPTLSICGGFQLMVECYGGEIGPMSNASSESIIADEKLLFDKTKGPLNGDLELGYTNLSILKPGEILANVPKEFMVYQYHYWCVKSMPKVFCNLARSENCKIQLVTHRQKPLYGCEFHPEIYNKEFPHGKQILTNFFNIAKSYRINPDEIRLMA